MKPFQPDQEYVYVTQADQKLPEDQQTRFVYGLLSVADTSKATRAATVRTGRGEEVDRHLLAVQITARALKRIENFGSLELPQPEPGRPVPVERRVEFLSDHLAPADRIEVSNAISEGQHVTPEDVRPCSAPPSSRT